MDFVFNCPHCNQELEVDTTAAGAAIDCPACNNKITIPQPSEAQAEAPQVAAPLNPPNAPPPTAPTHNLRTNNPMSSSAAAKEEKHFSVPVRNEPTASLIVKPPPPLEVAAKETGKGVRIKTIKHGDCVEVGKDKFDEIVSTFLDKIGADNIVSITTINYSHSDAGGRIQINDYGVLVVYKG